MWSWLAALGLALTAAAVSAAPAASSSDLMAALAAGGHVAILRHAIAPGGGDPPGFRIGDCATQRNLAEAGRQQASRIGNRLRVHGIERARVYSSQWCRTRETAEKLGLGKVVELPVLNSFFQTPEKADRQTVELRRWIQRQDLNEPLILVTHQVNITALTGIYPASGEMVILARKPDGSLEVRGNVKMD